MSKLLIWIGASLAALGLICCFTPLLPIVLGAAGLTSLLSLIYNDVVLLSVAGFGMAMVLIGVRAGRANRSAD